VSAEIDASNFPMPTEITEKLSELEKRISLLEKDKVEIHKIGMPSPLSMQFEK
jgi:hypothetical protein